jgi:hypothetical protein
MQDSDGPMQIETFSVPVWGPRSCVDGDARLVQDLIGRRKRSTPPTRRGRHVWQMVPVRPEETGPAVVLHCDSESLFVHGSVMTSAEEDKVVQPGGAAVSPMADVVRVAASCIANREAASAVAGRECPPDGGRDGPGLAPHVQYGAITSMTHDHSVPITVSASGDSAVACALCASLVT